MSALPSVGLDSTGNIYVVYQDNTVGNNEIYLKKSVDGGSVWTAKRLTSTAGASASPVIALDSADNVYVVYRENTAGKYEIYLKKSADGGSTWTSMKLTKDQTDSKTPSLAIDGADNVHVVYENNVSGNAEIYIGTSLDGGSDWTTKKLTATSGASLNPSAAVGSAGIIYAVFQDDTVGNAEIYLKKGVPQQKVAL